jgi:hypothetical protein
MATLTIYEILKYPWRQELWARKYKENENFELNNGKKMKFKFNKDIYAAMKKGNETILKNSKLLGDDGKIYAFGTIKKSAEFGGKKSGSGTFKEDMELKSLIEEINEKKKIEAQGYISIKVGTKKYKVASAETTAKQPKSDFHLVDINGKPVVWISHKDGSKPSDFQQWGGISARIEPKINAHPETKRFIEDLKSLWPKGLDPGESVFRKIKAAKLKMMSVYGNTFGSSLGEQNVSILIQGPVKLKKVNNVYIFESNHIHFNGDSVNAGGFKPVFAAMYRPDRNDAHVPKTRIVIMPEEGRKMSWEI